MAYPLEKIREDENIQGTALEVCLTTMVENQGLGWDIDARMNLPLTQSELEARAWRTALFILPMTETEWKAVGGEEVKQGEDYRPRDEETIKGIPASADVLKKLE